VQRGLNDRVVRRTKSAPFCVMFGRRGTRVAGEEDEEVGEEDADMLIQRNKEIFELVLPSLYRLVEDEGEKVCEYGDRRRKVVEKPYQEGTVVMVVSQAKRRGEDPSYKGLFTVVEFEEGKK
jgi:hypothetical protein